MGQVFSIVKKPFDRVAPVLGSLFSRRPGTVDNSDSWEQWMMAQTLGACHPPVRLREFQDPGFGLGRPGYCRCL